MSFRPQFSCSMVVRVPLVGHISSSKRNRPRSELSQRFFPKTYLFLAFPTLYSSTCLKAAYVAIPAILTACCGREKREKTPNGRGRKAEIRPDSVSRFTTTLHTTWLVSIFCSHWYVFLFGAFVFCSAGRLSRKNVDLEWKYVERVRRPLWL